MQQLLQIAAFITKRADEMMKLLHFVITAAICNKTAAFCDKTIFQKINMFSQNRKYEDLKK